MGTCRRQTLWPVTGQVHGSDHRGRYYQVQPRFALHPESKQGAKPSKKSNYAVEQDEYPSDSGGGAESDEWGLSVIEGYRYECGDMVYG